MTDAEKRSINDFVKVWRYEDAKWLIFCAIIITIIVIPLVTFSFVIQIRSNVLGSGWIYLLALGLLVVLLSGITLVKMKKQPILVHLFVTVASMVFSLTFFAIYYVSIYQILKLSSSMYLIGAILGYIVLLTSLIYYRYKVYKGYAANYGGSSKYGVIVSMTLFGSIVFKAIMSQMGENVQQMVLAMLSLLVAYVMAVGVVFVLNFIVGLK